MSLLTKRKDTTIEQAFVTSIDKVKGRVGLFLKNGLLTIGNYLYDINDLRVGISVIVSKVDGFYTIVNMIESDSVRKSYGKVQAFTFPNNNLDPYVPPYVPPVEPPTAEDWAIYANKGWRYLSPLNLDWATAWSAVNGKVVWNLQYDQISMARAQSFYGSADITRSCLQFPIPSLSVGKTFTSGTILFRLEDWGDPVTYSYAGIGLVVQLSTYNDLTNAKGTYSSMTGGATSPAYVDAYNDMILVTLTSEMLAYLTANAGGNVSFMLREYNHDFLNVEPVEMEYELVIWGYDAWPDSSLSPLLSLTME